MPKKLIQLPEQDSPEQALGQSLPDSPALNNASLPAFNNAPQHSTQQSPQQSTQQAQLLAQMKDIQTPAEVDWWPPAIGWWLLVALVLSSFITAVNMLLQKNRRSKYRRQALQQLKLIEKESRQVECITQTMQLLKQVVFTAYPYSRNDVSGIFGREFLKLLDALLTRADSTDTSVKQQALFLPLSAFVESNLYSDKADVDVQQQARLLEATRAFIKQHKALKREQFTNVLQQHLGIAVNTEIRGRSYVSV